MISLFASPPSGVSMGFAAFSSEGINANFVASSMPTPMALK